MRSIVNKSYILACLIFYCLPIQSTFKALGSYTLDFIVSDKYMIVRGFKGLLGIVDLIKMSLIKEFQVCLVRLKLGLYGSTLAFINMLSLVLLSGCHFNFFGRHYLVLVFLQITIYDSTILATCLIFLLSKLVAKNGFNCYQYSRYQVL